MKYVYGQGVKKFKNGFASLVASLAILANSAGLAIPVLLTQPVYAAGTETIYTQPMSSMEVAAGSSMDPQVDASGHNNLKLSFHYDAENMDDGDNITYGWSIGVAAPTVLGTIDGHDEGVAGDEVGDITDVSLPAGAEISNLRLVITNNSDSPSDTVYISDLTLTGELATTPQLTNVDSYYSSGTGYTGIGIDFTTKNVTTATDVELRVNRDGGEAPVSIHGTSVLLNSINTSATAEYTTSGTVIITGSRTSSSGSWPTMIGTWTGPSRPVNVEVLITLQDGTVLNLADNTIVDNSGNSQASVFASVPAFPLATCNASTFDAGFVNGSVNGQNGWKVTNSSFDQEVVDNTYGYASFGCKTLRISNSHTTGSFGDQTFSAPATDLAGEALTNDHYEASFSFGSTKQSEQPGMALSISPDDGSGNRMSYIGLSDNSTGTAVTFYDTDSAGNFVSTSLGTVSRNQAHTIKFVIDFVDGESNDIVKIYLDGSLVHTGTTWEQYYRLAPEQAGNGNVVPNVDRLIFRSAGTAIPNNAGNGYVFDSVSTITSQTIPPDTTRPVISVHGSSPVEGDYLSGNRYTRKDQPNQQRNRFIFNVTDDSGIKKVAMYLYDADKNKVDEYALTQHTTQTNQWYADVDTTQYGDGFHSISARAVDNAGNAKYFNNRKDGYHVYFDNSKPAANVVSPATGDVTKGTFTVTGTASDAVSDIDRVQYTLTEISGIGGTYVSSIDSGVATGTTDWSFPVSGLSDGYYRLKVQAFDLAGNWKYDYNDVVVDNTAPAVNGVVLNGQTVDMADVRYNNCDPVLNTYLVSGELDLNATITDPSNVTKSKYKLRRVTDNGCTHEGSERVKMHDTGGNVWEEAPGWVIDTRNVNSGALSGELNGQYTLMIVSRDSLGNESNTYIDVLIDNTAPSSPTITAPGASTWHKTTPINTTWTAATDDNGIASYQVGYHYDDGHTFGSSTCPGEMIGGTALSGCRNTTNTSRNHAPNTGEQGGVTVWVRAIDNAGNKGSWSKSVHYYYDNTDPTTDIVAPTGAVNGNFVVSGDAHDNLSLNRVYVQLVNRQNNQRYGGTTINLIPNGINPAGVNAHWSNTFDVAALGLPDGDYAAHVEVVDMAGNSSTAGWTANFNVDNTAPAVPTGLNYTTDLGRVLASGDSTNEITGLFDWDNVSDADRYNLYVWNDNPSSIVYATDISGKHITDPAGFTDSQVPGNLAALQAREYPQYVCVTAVDVAGNESACSTPFSLILDQTAPVVTVDTIAPVEEGESVNVTGSVDDLGILTVEILVDGVSQGAANVVAGAFSFNVDGLSAGDYDITVRAADTAGNAGEATQNVEVDEPPVVLGAADDNQSSDSNDNDKADKSETDETNPEDDNVVITDNNGQATAEDATEEEDQEKSEEGTVLQSATNDGEENKVQLDEDKGCYEVFGICWYLWTIPVIAILVYLFYRFSKDSDK